MSHKPLAQRTSNANDKPTMWTNKRTTQKNKTRSNAKELNKEQKKEQTWAMWIQKQGVVLRLNLIKNTKPLWGFYTMGIIA
jgi:hypothetical protein